MSTTIDKIGVGLCVAIVVIWVCGCGGGDKKPTAAEAAPFQSAIATYLDSKSMDLKVFDFRKLDVTDDLAEGEVSLEHAGGMVGPKVRWTFWFEKRNGTWVATRHEQ